MIFDTHMHCDYSCDSEMKFADAIGAAAEQGIGITVTEHWDYDYPTNPEAFIFDIDEYFARLRPLSSDEVLIGIEIGMQTHTAAEDKKVAQAHPLTMCWPLSTASADVIYTSRPATRDAHVSRL